MRLLLCAVMFCAFLKPALGQSELTRVFPNGARQGSKLTLTLGGTVPEKAELLVEGQGIRPLGAFVKGVGEVEVAADATPGMRQLRLAGEKAATNPRPFSVGSLPEMEEKEPNNRPEQAQPVEKMPLTINGTLPTRPDIDLFKVSLKRGQCLVVAGESRALGAPTNLLVRIRDTAGREMVVQMDYRTRDPVTTFTAPADADYLVELQEVMNNYSEINADYVYRVTLTTGPWLDSAFPPGARRGETTRVTFNGWNLDGISGPSTVEAMVTVPADAPSRYSATAGGAPNSVRIATGTAPEVSEKEPNSAAAPQELTAPCTVNAWLDEVAPSGDRDCYRFRAKASETLLLDVDGRDLGSFADPLLTVLDSNGKVLATADDTGRRRDPRLFWKAPADGDYILRIRDAAGGPRGGPGFFYRLTIAPPAPSLELAVQEPTLVLKPGGTVEIPLTVTRTAVRGSINIQAEGLPAGVTAAPLVLPQKGDGQAETTDQVKLALTAAQGMAPCHARIRIVATSTDTPPLTARAAAAWVLSKDRSGTLETGSTTDLLLLVPAP